MTGFLVGVLDFAQEAGDFGDILARFQNEMHQRRETLMNDVSFQQRLSRAECAELIKIHEVCPNVKAMNMMSINGTLRLCVAGAAAGRL